MGWGMMGCGHGVHYGSGPENYIHLGVSSSSVCARAGEMWFSQTAM